MWHSCAERVVFVVFVVHAVQHGVAWMLGVACVVVGGAIRVSQPLVRPVVSLPEGIRYVVLWRMVERLRTLWGVRGTRYTTRICENCGYDRTRISHSREDARATSRDPPTATRRVSAFTPRVRSGQCRVAFSLTLSHAFRVRPLRLGATRFAGPRGFVGPSRYIRWPRRGRHAAQRNNSGK